jgi:hypothetical protein
MSPALLLLPSHSISEFEKLMDSLVNAFEAEFRALEVEPQEEANERDEMRIEGPDNLLKTELAADAQRDESSMDVEAHRTEAKETNKEPGGETNSALDSKQQQQDQPASKARHCVRLPAEVVASCLSDVEFTTEDVFYNINAGT